MNRRSFAECASPWKEKWKENLNILNLHSKKWINTKVIIDTHRTILFIKTEIHFFSTFTWKTVQIAKRRSAFFVSTIKLKNRYRIKPKNGKTLFPRFIEPSSGFCPFFIQKQASQDPINIAERKQQIRAPPAILTQKQNQYCRRLFYAKNDEYYRL